MRSIILSMLLFFWRKHLFTALGIARIVVVLIASVLSQFVIQDTSKVFIDAYMGGMHICLSLLLLYIGSRIIKDEYQQHTIEGVFTTPLPKYQFLGAKMIARILYLLIAFVIFAIGMYGIGLQIDIRAWMTHGQFRQAQLSGLLSQILLLCCLVFFATRFPPLGSVMLTLAVFFIGHVSPFLVWYSSHSGVLQSMHGLLKGIYYLSPPFSHLHHTNALTSSLSETFFAGYGYSVLAGVVYIVILWVLLSFSFEHKHRWLQK